MALEPSMCLCTRIVPEAIHPVKRSDLRLWVALSSMLTGEELLDILRGNWDGFPDLIAKTKKLHDGQAPVLKFGKIKDDNGKEWETSGKADSNATPPTVTLDREKSTDKIDAAEALLFELHNLASRQQFQDLHNVAALGKVSVNAYVERMEYIEFLSVMKVLKTMQEITKRMMIEHVSIFNVFKDVTFFIDFYKIVSDTHKKFSMDFWNAIYKQAY